jgi:hypothetical protein
LVEPNHFFIDLPRREFVRQDVLATLKKYLRIRQGVGGRTSRFIEQTNEMLRNLEDGMNVALGPNKMGILTLKEVPRPKQTVHAGLSFDAARLHCFVEERVQEDFATLQVVRVKEPLVLVPPLLPQMCFMNCEKLCGLGRFADCGRIFAEKYQPQLVWILGNRDRALRALRGAVESQFGQDWRGHRLNIDLEGTAEICPTNLVTAELHMVLKNAFGYLIRLPQGILDKKRDLTLFFFVKIPQ